MFTLLTLFCLMVAGVVCFVAFFAVVMIVKTVVHVALWPLKLLFLPFLLVGLVIKLAFLLTVGAMVLAVLIPLAILLLLFAAPFLLISALT